MNKPGQWVEIKQSELQKLRDELAAAQGELKAIFQAVHGSDEGTCDSVIMEFAKVKMERDYWENAFERRVKNSVTIFRDSQFERD